MRLKMTVEKCPTGAGLEVPLECSRPFPAFERRCRPNFPRSEFGRVRNSPCIVLGEAFFQMGGDSGVNLIGIGKRLQDVNLMEFVHRVSPPSLAGASYGGRLRH